MICLRSGQLSKNDIIDNELIYPHGDNNNYKASSYDITPTAVAMSTRSGMLETVYTDRNNHYQNVYYIYVRPKDSVLIISNEFISLPDNISGYVSSRVSNVARGFGHICTTIDPGWNGAILVALSNPTNSPIRIEVGTDDKSSRPLASLTFHYLSRKIEISPEHKSMRLDILRKNAYFNQKGLKAWFRKTFFRKRRAYTDDFFNYVNAHKCELCSAVGWERFLDEFSRFNGERSKNYIKRDSWIKRALRWLESHYIAIAICVAVICILISFLGTLGLLSEDQIQRCCVVLKPFLNIM